MGNAVDITNSDITRFKKCRMAWDFGSTMRRSRTPKHTAQHFIVGDLFHQAMEQFYTKQTDDPAAVFNTLMHARLTEIPSDYPQLEKLIEQLTNMEKIIRAYARWAARNDDFEVVSAEQRLSLRLNGVTPGHFFSFKFDALVMDKQGHYWLMDFKTANNMPTNFDWLDIDDQAVSYQWAAEEVLQLPISGMIYNFISKKEIKKPRTLLNGEISSAAIVTTYEEAVAAIEEAGLNKDDYADYLKRVLDGENQLFTRYTVRATKLQRQLLGAQIKNVAQEMSNPNVLIYHTPDKIGCSFCDFKLPCALRLAGRNFQHTLETDYTEAEPRL